MQTAIAVANSPIANHAVAGGWGLGKTRKMHVERPAHENSLTARIERVVEVGDDLALSGRLTFAANRKCGRQLECLAERSGDHRERCALPRHRGPFHILCFLDVRVDERTHACLRVGRKRSRQQHDCAQRACFAIHRRGGAIDVPPYLSGNEGDEQPEDDAERRKQTG